MVENHQQLCVGPRGQAAPHPGSGTRRRRRRGLTLNPKSVTVREGDVLMPVTQSPHVTHLAPRAARCEPSCIHVSMPVSHHWRSPPLQDESELPLGLALPALSVAAPLTPLPPLPCRMSPSCPWGLRCRRCPWRHLWPAWHGLLCLHSRARQGEEMQTRNAFPPLQCSKKCT